MLAVAVVAVAGIGWAMPLLGWSLLGFLVIDLVAGLIARQRGGERPDRSQRRVATG